MNIWRSFALFLVWLIFSVLSGFLYLLTLWGYCWLTDNPSHPAAEFITFLVGVIVFEIKFPFRP